MTAAPRAAPKKRAYLSASEVMRRTREVRDLRSKASDPLECFLYDAELRALAFLWPESAVRQHLLGCGGPGFDCAVGAEGPLPDYIRSAHRVAWDVDRLWRDLHHLRRRLVDHDARGAALAAAHVQRDLYALSGADEVRAELRRDRKGRSTGGKITGAKNKEAALPEQRELVARYHALKGKTRVRAKKMAMQDAGKSWRSLSTREQSNLTSSMTRTLKRAFKAVGAS